MLVIALCREPQGAALGDNGRYFFIFCIVVAALLERRRRRRAWRVVSSSSRRIAASVLLEVVSCSYYVEDRVNRLNQQLFLSDRSCHCRSRMRRRGKWWTTVFILALRDDHRVVSIIGNGGVYHNSCIVQNFRKPTTKRRRHRSRCRRCRSSSSGASLWHGRWIDHFLLYFFFVLFWFPLFILLLVFFEGEDWENYDDVDALSFFFFCFFCPAASALVALPPHLPKAMFHSVCRNYLSFFQSGQLNATERTPPILLDGRPCLVTVGVK